MTNFTNNWFEITAIENFKKYVPKNGIFLEIGCYEGQASCWLLENTACELVVVDTFAGGQDLPEEEELLQRFKSNTIAYDNRIDVIVGRSQDVLKKKTERTFNFIYIDGSHLASDTLEDAILSFSLLEKNGIMIFDDYTWGQGMHPLETPKFGIDAFVNVYADQLEVLERNSQLVLRKL